MQLRSMNGTREYHRHTRYKNPLIQKEAKLHAEIAKLDIPLSKGPCKKNKKEKVLLL